MFNEAQYYIRNPLYVMLECQLLQITDYHFRLFYAGAVEGQMPEILSMIQVNKMTPAPAVLIVVSRNSLKNLFSF